MHGLVMLVVLFVIVATIAYGVAISYGVDFKSVKITATDPPDRTSSKSDPASDRSAEGIEEFAADSEIVVSRDPRTSCRTNMVHSGGPEYKISGVPELEPEGSGTWKDKSICAFKVLSQDSVVKKDLSDCQSLFDRLGPANKAVAWTRVMKDWSDDDRCAMALKGGLQENDYKALEASLNQLSNPGQQPQQLLDLNRDIYTLETDKTTLYNLTADFVTKSNNYWTKYNSQIAPLIGSIRTLRNDIQDAQDTKRKLENAQIPPYGDPEQLQAEANDLSRMNEDLKQLIGTNKTKKADADVKKSDMTNMTRGLASLTTGYDQEYNQLANGTTDRACYSAIKAYEVEYSQKEPRLKERLETDNKDGLAAWRFFNDIGRSMGHTWPECEANDPTISPIVGPPPPTWTPPDLSVPNTVKFVGCFQAYDGNIDDVLGSPREYFGGRDAATFHAGMAKAIVRGHKYFAFARVGQDGFGFTFNNDPKPGGLRTSDWRQCGMTCLDDNGKSCGEGNHQGLRKWAVYATNRSKYVIKSSQDRGKCLDLDGRTKGDGTPVMLWNCHGGTNQQWFTTGDGLLRNASRLSIHGEWEEPGNICVAKTNPRRVFRFMTIPPLLYSTSCYNTNATNWQTQDLLNRSSEAQINSENYCVETDGTTGVSLRTGSCSSDSTLQRWKSDATV